jgi:hypothetical protein
LSTRETVAAETPARAATSESVTDIVRSTLVPATGERLASLLVVSAF